MQDTIDMRNVERIPSLEQRNIVSWPRFLLESVLAIGGALVVTGLISLFQLYPQIPNISLAYLLLQAEFPRLQGNLFFLYRSMNLCISFCGMSFSLQLLSQRDMLQ